MKVIEGIASDPVLDCGEWAILTDDGNYWRVDSSDFEERKRYRITIEELPTPDRTSDDR